MCRVAFRNTVCDGVGATLSISYLIGHLKTLQQPSLPNEYIRDCFEHNSWNLKTPLLHSLNKNYGFYKGVLFPTICKAERATCGRFT